MQTNNNVAELYKKFKNEIVSYTNSDIPLWMPGCNNFNNQHIDNSKYEAPKLCAIAVNFLNQLKIKYDPSQEEDGCKYLYHWLNTEAVKSKTSIENTLDLYKELNDIFNEHNDGDHMFDKYRYKMNTHTCKKIDKIIGLYELFNKFESQYVSKPSEVNCTSNCSELFTSYVNECRKLYDYDFCNRLKIFREYHNTFIQKVMRCDGEQYILPPVDKFNIVGIILIPFVLILVTSFIFPILYKFTPVGPWIRHKFGKKKNIWYNINEETDKLINAYEMEEHKSSKQNYNIAYN
ncbi:PIR protein [Plasmodium ovale]|uniref:PIR Superfamily Protein n=2 Tax=Plasmodium ovale TaxID=36330 RepID=A0A1A8WJS2_PLAOA|nr:PIR Superfamily Protein [Plasmodium ovale curtisi]SBT84694.1 PIR protein [Plasmodium ovale]